MRNEKHEFVSKTKSGGGTLLLALLIALSAVSCGDNSIDNKDTLANDSSETTVSEADELKPVLPDVKYDTEFTILTKIEGWGIYNNEHIYVEEENADLINDAIYQRTNRVADRFGISFIEVEANDGNFDSVITQTVMANDDEYDLMVATYLPNLGNEYLVDWNELEYVDLTKPWWDQNYVDTMSINGVLCSMVGNVMITQMDSVFSMFYNKDLAEQYKLPDLYQIVRDGDWTLPKYFELTRDITNDLDGNDEYDDNDIYAFTGLDGMSRLSSGVKLDYLVKDSDDIPQLNFSSSKLVDSVMKISEYSSLYTKDIYNPRSNKNTGGDGDAAVFRMFNSGHSLFYVHGTGSAQKFRDMNSDFGIIPTPKLDDEQENYFIEPDVTKCMVIPTTAGDLERTSVILEALCYEGYSYLRPIYYDTMLKNKYMRDDESIEMLDSYIYPNIGYTLKSGSDTLSQVMGTIKNSANVASTLASNQAKIEEELAKYIELFH